MVKAKKNRDDVSGELIPPVASIADWVRAARGCEAWDTGKTASQAEVNEV